MNLLPKWALLNPLPAIYDFESVTPLQQTARVYGAMQEMIREYNAFADLINKEMQSFVGSSEEEIKNFKKSVEERIRCKFNDMDATFAKIKSDLVTYTNDYLAKVPALPVVYDTDNEKVARVINGVWQAVKLVDKTLSYSGMAADAAETGKDIEDIRNRLNNLLNSVVPGSTTMDAEIFDLRLGIDGKTYNSAGEAVRAQVGKLNEQVNAGVRTYTEYVKFEHPGDESTNIISVEKVGTNKIRVVHEEHENPDGLRRYFLVAIPIGKLQDINKKFTAETSAGWSHMFVSDQYYSWGGAKLVRIERKKQFNPYELFVNEYPDTDGAKEIYCVFGKEFPSTDSVFPYYENEIVVLSEEDAIVKATELDDKLRYEVCSVVGVRTYTDCILGTNTNNVPVTITKSAHTIKIERAAHSHTSGTDQFSISVLLGKLGEINKSFIAEYASKWDYIVIGTSAVKGTFNPAYGKVVTIGNKDSFNPYEIIKAAYPELEDSTDIYIGCWYSKNATGDIPRYENTIRVYTKEGSFVMADALSEKVWEEIDDRVEKNAEKYVVCWGDSLTAQGGWTTTLQDLSGIPVLNAGTGGENTNCIMARQGADVMIVNDITIPADTSPIVLASRANGESLKTQFGRSVMPLLQGGSSHVNPVKIGDVLGNLAWTGSSYSDTTGTWTFTRKEAGEAVTINRPTAMTTAYDREKNAPWLMVVFMGQNDGNFDNETLIRKHKQMIQHSDAKNVVVLGLSSGTAESRAAYETAMRDEFGRYFISLREYLSKYGLEDAGLTPTADDTAAMEIGQVPPQLLADTVHYTTACRTVIGNMLYKKCCELGIF